MDTLFSVLGGMGLLFLLAVGVLAGWIASLLNGGRHKLRYIAMGVVGALIFPLLLAVLGATVVAAGGLVLLVLSALVGAAILLVIAKLVFD
ncbi:hypothetical protein AQS8620_02736 [Aquimixticola soesokkakensis]|uniref:Major facilitator superfamily (MFS) profile domain-containing protein n=1 Tax=Aquimixticola soesokkakensis TaxID=1519096 RepID=A0A1Y5TCH8_9RHOB|nr:GlsB/YeaQ/YmgE family stress response membrane protein [Aquimixticola soesokkakensis]SLN60588.1 hypothetical protein AQS8620_02736 [Aquimixticola soesokkakensis]